MELEITTEHLQIKLTINRNMTAIETGEITSVLTDLVNSINSEINGNQKRV